MTTTGLHLVQNYVSGRWTAGSGEAHDLFRPATGEKIGEVRFSTAEDVDAAVRTAREAFTRWRDVPLPERIRYLFALRQKMDENFEELAQLIVHDEGKTIDDARGEVRRGIENVEVACGTPNLMSGEALNQLAAGVDSVATYYPVGVSAIIAPFNFPLMVPLWFLPYAIACGNTVVIKPSEQVPLALEYLARLIEETGLPAGVFNMIQGGREAVEALCEHPEVDSVSFVGSEGVGRRVYQLATHHGKRAQCLAGAKNYLVVMPDADVELTSRAVISSAFGAAGERCLAGSMMVPVGDSRRFGQVREAVIDAASRLKVGDGARPETNLGPLISKAHQERVLEHIQRAADAGARLALDGRAEAERPGYFLGPTVIEDLTPGMEIAGTEVFGPVLGVMPASSIEEAVDAVARTRYGNAAAIFTSSGRAAREFARRVPAGMVGVNIGVAAPMAYFPFSGWRQSFFGDLHGQGRDSVRFFTRPKVVISRWS